MNPLSDANGPLEVAQEDHRRKKAEVARLWAAFSEKKQAVEAAGARTAEVKALERDYYEPYAEASKSFEFAEERYRSLLEREARLQPSVLAADSADAAGFLRHLKGASLGDHSAFGRLLGMKGWIEGTDASGGYLVNPAVLPGYLPALRASSPLRSRFTNVNVSSNEVWVTLEGNSVSVAHVAEAGVKPDSTGSLAQKISTVYKAAGTSRMSDELLADSAGYAADLIANQFAKSIGILVDQTIISGSGTGSPTGIRNTTGVTSTAVDGQGGPALYNSILKATGRLRVNFLEPDTIVVHPRDLVKFELAADTTGNYIFPGGLGSALASGLLVPDANVPTNLGAGTNESIAIVGAFRQGGYFFSRTPLVVEASRDAGWQTDETVFRGVERYGFAVVRAQAFEILTGITP